MEGLFQPAHLFFIILVLPILLIMAWLIFRLVRTVDQRVDQEKEALRHQILPPQEILRTLEKINSTLERIEHKLEPTRKGE